MDTKDLEQIRTEARARELKELRRQNRKYFLISCLSVTAFLLLWQAVVSFHLVDTRFIDSPAKVFMTVVDKWTNNKPEHGLLWQHIIASSIVVWKGFLLGAVIGIPLGLLMGWNRWFEHTVRPLFEIIRPIPALAWIPIILLFFGIGERARSIIIFFGAFVGDTLNSYTGIRSTKQVYINVAKTCGAKDPVIFWRVGIPSAMPMIFAGLEISIASSWGTVCAAEMLAASNGLGYMIQMGRMFGSVSLIMGGMAVIGIMGYLSTYIIEIVEHFVLRWRPSAS